MGMAFKHLGPFGAVLGPLELLFGPSSALLGRYWEAPGAPWEALGELLGRPGAVQNRSKNRSENRSEIESDPGAPKWPKHYACRCLRRVGTLTVTTSGRPPKLSIPLKI